MSTSNPNEDVNQQSHSRAADVGQSDAELVGRCRQGDMSAWRSLYDRYAPAVFRFVAAMGVPGDEREDIAQDVFINVYRSLAQFRGEAQLSTWIYRIAARHAGRLGKKRKLREILGTLIQKEMPAAPPPVDPAERAAHLLLLDSLLARLHPKKRTVFVLFEIEGLKIDEIARTLECPENTVWSRLHHARAEILKMARKQEAAHA